MQVSISNPGQQTYIFAAILVVALLLSIRKKTDQSFFSFAITNELKGFAVLAVIFSHVGYFLATDNKFLFPLSVFAGVGVDLFLLLSGYGLTCSALRKETKPWQFYIKRFDKIYLPLWLTLVAFFLADIFLLKIPYSPAYIIRAFLGIITRADLYQDVNSPLWYITLILFYYLVFPWIFKKKYPLASAAGLFFLPYLILKFQLPVSDGVTWLYSVHIIGFPVGVAFAAIATQLQSAKNFWQKAKIWAEKNQTTYLDIKIGAACLFALMASYYALNSGVGKGLWTEEIISVFIALLVLATALTKPFEIKLLQIIGAYSYEIYLLHWPLMYRYDFLYQYMPAGVATALYIAVLLGIGLVVQWLTSLITKIFTRKKQPVA